MTQDEIIRMARDADLICESRPVTAWLESTNLTPYLTRFAALVAAHEREACANVCEEGIHNAEDWDSSYWDQCCNNRAAAIRARGEK